MCLQYDHVSLINSKLVRKEYRDRHTPTPDSKS